MQKSSILLFSLLACACSCMAQPKDKLERLMDYYATHDNFNGTVLVTRKGAILMARGYGYSDEKANIKNNENTIFQLGPNTMQFTTEVILQLDSKGKLGLEDRVTKYIPDFPYGSRISIKNLLTHSSGLYDYTRDSMLSRVHPEKPMGKDEIMGRFKNVPFAFDPGTRFEYSNSNFFLLGIIIEKITHKKYENEVKENILHVCGMSHSGFDFTRLRSENKATGYSLGRDGILREAPITDSSVSFAAGGLYSTAGDLLKWHRALLHHKLLPKDWQDLGYTPVRSDYALGWSLISKYNKRFMEHAGSISGFSSCEVRQEDDDLLIVLLENRMRPGETDEAIANNILQCLYDKNYQLPGQRKAPVMAAINERPQKKEKPISAGNLKKYTGTFEITPAFTLSFTIAGDELVAASPDKQSIKMIQESETMFRIAGMNDEIEFIKGKDGKVNRIVLHQNGELIPGVRSK